MPKLPNVSKSVNRHQIAKELIPCGTQMLAKGTDQHSFGISPIYVSSGNGGHFTDIDGNEFIDMTMGMGPVTLGYCFDAVDQAICNQLNRGINYTLIDPLEMEVSRLIIENIPSAEMVRFAKSGAEATGGAVRLARAYTGREKVICCGYHGWHDFYISQTHRKQGVPDAVSSLSLKVNYNDLEALDAVLTEDIACLIMEPVIFENPHEGYLEEVRKRCDEYGIVLIFDEIWTGFRISLGGAQKFFGVMPDLTILSKGCANGMPISIICGKKNIMKKMESDDFFFFSTFGGEALSLAATKATIDFMMQNPVIENNKVKNATLRDKFNFFCDEHEVNFMRAQGLDYRSIINFTGFQNQKEELICKTYFQQELIKRGILWTGFHQCCYSHTQNDIDAIVEAYAEVIPDVNLKFNERQLENSLQGEVLKPVFRNMGLGRH